MTLPLQTLDASLTLSPCVETRADRLVAPMCKVLSLFGATDAEVETGFDEARIRTDAVTVEIVMRDIAEEFEDEGLRIDLFLTQHDDLPVGHAAAIEVLLAELVHVGIEETGAAQVDWQGAALLEAREFQALVPSVRFPARPAAEVAAEAPRTEPAALPATEESARVVPMPRRIRPETDLRASGTVVDSRAFAARKAQARRLRQYESFDEYEAAKGRPLVRRITPVEPLENVFRMEMAPSPEILGQHRVRHSIERQVASWTIAASVGGMLGMGFSEAVASTLQALPF